MRLFIYFVYIFVCVVYSRCKFERLVDMKILILLLVLVGVSSCAVKRTRDSDKTLRVMLDPKSTNPDDYALVQHALVDSGKFYVVDRNHAFKALKTEQFQANRANADRYADSQKYAHWGELYGAGGVVVVSVKCSGVESRKNIVYFVAHLATLGMFDKELCTQLIELVDTNTGEVVASAKNEARRAYGDVLDWSDAVDELVSNYPKYFESVKKHEKLIKYEEQTETLSKLQKQ